MNGFSGEMDLTFPEGRALELDVFCCKYKLDTQVELMTDIVITVLETL